MMGYGYGFNGWGTMGSGIGFMGALVCVVLFIDLVLAGIWLWQNISKK